MIQNQYLINFRIELKIFYDECNTNTKLNENIKITNNIGLRLPVVITCLNMLLTLFTPNYFILFISNPIEAIEK